MTKTCVWLSRHKPRPEQLESLTHYHVIQRHPPGRFRSARHAALLALDAAGGRWPELVVTVMPRDMLAQFVLLVGKHTTVLHPVIDHDAEPTRWLGWEVAQDVKVVWRNWTPEQSEVKS